MQIWDGILIKSKKLFSKKVNLELFYPLSLVKIMQKSIQKSRPKAALNTWKEVLLGL